MIEIKRKDLPLNTSMTFFECILNEPEMDKQIIKEIDEQAYLNTVYAITEKRSNSISETNNYKKKKKLIDFLMRKGFENELIFKTVNDVLEESI